mmetsp:Transcript_62020/g.146854  ORF Transcript_62020/g.146854 Transcript_62020/m.146854 type:complete len:184 (+) Transcript_62020:22-573(+)
MFLAISFDCHLTPTAQSEDDGYMAARRDAIRLGRQQRKLYHSASVAFALNDHANARELSRQARLLSPQIQDLHSQAAQTIFDARNKDWAARLPERGRATIDLHGLHPDEAVGIVDDCLAKVAAESGRPAGTEVQLDVVTGVGTHSEGAPSLLPRLITHLTAQQASFFERRAGLTVRIQLHRET